ncbi:jg18036 [Pararge aegeria aegeria]|uniref:Jg18036 protein n=1 Tax=Pararge aegeria aegeria TaxID=348720 RepID=A0A8S4QJV4_9NEOP|nr:jg18036 [Pararge aegeria aegeria]
MFPARTLLRRCLPGAAARRAAVNQRWAGGDAETNPVRLPSDTCPSPPESNMCKKLRYLRASTSNILRGNVSRFKAI